MQGQEPHDARSNVSSGLDIGASECHSHSGVLAEVGHLRMAVEALSEKVKRHEERLRRLDRPRRAD